MSGALGEADAIDASPPQHTAWPRPRQVAETVSARGHIEGYGPAMASSDAPEGAAFPGASSRHMSRSMSRRANLIAAAIAMGCALLSLLALATVVSAAPATAQHAAQTAANSVEVEQAVVAARTIRAGTVLAADDLAFSPRDDFGPGATFESMSGVVGREARVSIYAGRPIRPGEIGAPTIIDRNAIVKLSFKLGALVIETEGRALDAGGLGDRIRVMNLDSRRTVSGTVAGPQLVVTP